jgi:hypothetical protein
MKRSAAIDGDTLIQELLDKHSGLTGVFVRIGLPGFVCGEPAWGTVGELCERRGRSLTEVQSVLRAAVSRPGGSHTGNSGCNRRY